MRPQKSNGGPVAALRFDSNPFWRSRRMIRQARNGVVIPYLVLSADGKQVEIVCNPAKLPFEWRMIHCTDGVTWGGTPHVYSGEANGFMVDNFVLEFLRIQGFDAEGNAVTEVSNTIIVPLAAPVLTGVFDDSSLSWTFEDQEGPLPDPVRWNVWVSMDGGATFVLPEDYWAAGNARAFAPDGGSELYFIVGVDAEGREITVRSNAVCPDNSLVKLPAPVLTANPATGELVWTWASEHADPVKWNVWMSFDDGVSFLLEEDYWAAGSARSFAPDGGSESYLVVGVNARGFEITERSNMICPDDVPLPPSTLKNGLLGYWGMDETEGNFLDATGNENDGVLVGESFTRGVAGKVGNALEVTSAAAPQTRVVTPITLACDFSVSMWVKTGNTGWATLVSQTSTGCRGMGLFCYDGGLYFSVYTGDPETLNPGAESGGFSVVGPGINDGNWHHVVCLLNEDSTAMIYVDGVFCDATTGTYSMYPAPDPLMFFENSSCFGQILVGTMDELGVWNRALTLAEVVQLYNAGSGLGFGEL